MNWGHLADHFSGVGIKRLSDVDANPKKSNQHEIGTTKSMREFLGEKDQKQFNVSYIWLDDNKDNLIDVGKATLYDARNKKTERTPEWRLYYESNQVTESMKPGDTLLIAVPKKNDKLLKFIVAPAGSTSEQQLCWLFGIKQIGSRLSDQKYEGNEFELNFMKSFLLNEIGVEIFAQVSDELDEMLGEFGAIFPTTNQLSDFARKSLPSTRVEEDPDATLMAWIEREEALFRRLEIKFSSDRIEQGFVGKSGVEFEEFISFALSILNRRKSRMGRSLENHLAAVFQELNIPFSREPVTELGKRPDFIFPSIEEYRNSPNPEQNLVMLGVKSTCKDRWRQVLAEADKIPKKHLLTLEPGISENQTTQMRNENLTLVVPKPIQASYSNSQCESILSLQSFIEMVKNRFNLD